MRARSVTILGLGLIGGSLGLALKQPPREQAHAWATPVITGWDRDRGAIEAALARGAIDRLANGPRSAVAGADVVVVAVPALAIRDLFAEFATALAPETIVTDVASTKTDICRWATELLPVAFVGGHPMAGSERSGVAHAQPDLFAGATYCLTPLPSTPPSAIELITDLVAATGAEPYIVGVEAHDRAVAAISHLPFLLSTLLVDLTAHSPEWELFRTIAARGYRDVSRLASGDPRMHRDICVTNATYIRPWLLEASQLLQTLATNLDNPEALDEWFEGAKIARDEWMHERGPHPRER